METKTISDFLSVEYKEFAMYSIEGRAIPSFIDGFKPSQRKVIHIANQIWKTGNEKTLKVFQLAGEVASKAFFHHGNVSLENAIVNMAQKFKNNSPLLEEDGQFGSIRSPQAGASRYIGTKLSQNFRLIYKDFELLEFKEEEGEKIEPKFFLPIVPTILLNGSSGIAVGFASNILNRNIKDIVESCISYLKNGKFKSPPPLLNCFMGSYIQDSENHKRWIIRGKFEKINTNTIKITELPPSLTYEKYEEILDRLVESKQIISYEDNCKDNINYTIKLTRESLGSLSNDQIFKFLKLEEYETEIYSTLDEFGKLKIFNSVDDIIKYFLDFRIKFYQKRKDHLIDKISRELNFMKNRGKFIKLILDNKIIVNNKLKNEIEAQIKENSLDKIDDSYDYLLRLPIHSLSKESFERIKEDFTSKKLELESTQKMNPKDMYLDDLEELKSKVK